MYLHSHIYPDQPTNNGQKHYNIPEIINYLLHNVPNGLKNICKNPKDSYLYTARTPVKMEIDRRDLFGKKIFSKFLSG